VQSAFSALLQEFLNAHQILAGSRVLGEFGHALTAVEFLDGGYDCFALRLCLGESNGIRKVAIGNINGGFHDSILLICIFPVKENRNTPAGFRGRYYCSHFCTSTGRFSALLIAKNRVMGSQPID
jgi:hypothetical protein